MSNTTAQVYYHWTHLDNLPSIDRTGLDPEYATGDMYAVWFCRRGQLDWAMDHVARKHGWKPSELVLLRFRVKEKHRYRTKWEGIFYSPRGVESAALEIQTENGQWLGLEEYFSTPMMPVDVPDFS